MKKYIVFVIAFIITASLISTYTYSARSQNNIAQQIIRFHVLANSDSNEDQTLKLKVRDRVLKELTEELSIAENIQETRNTLYDNMHAIRQVALEEIKLNGYDYDVRVYMTKDYFPTKVYGDVSLPAGKYEALRIEIGQAQGQNWWCVMFPPLCYVDVTQKQVPVKEKMMLKNVLEESEYELITKYTPEVKVKFKVVEVWNKVKSKL